MKYDKHKEDNYSYWQGQFDGHQHYMVSGEGNEYYFIREIILKEIKSGESLLDVGCASGGTYRHIKEFSKKTIKYKGIDFAEKFIEANKEQMPKIDWEVGDARYLKEPDKSWDNVLIYDSIDRLDGWEKALDEADRVAKKQIILIMWIDNNMDEKRDYLEKLGYSIKQFTSMDGMNYHYFVFARRKNGV